MSRALTVEVSELAYAAIERDARAAAQSPAEHAATALEQRFSPADETSGPRQPTERADIEAARSNFERHFGSVNLGYPTGTDNEAIDADLAREYADNHEEA